MIDLTDELVEELTRRAREAAPKEACGLLGYGESGLTLYGCENAAESPVTSFLISPREQLAALTTMKRRGEALAAIWHSHPRSAPEPSPRDRVMAEGWPGVVWVIVGLQKCPNCDDGVIAACCGKGRDECCGRPEPEPCPTCGGDGSQPSLWLGYP